MNNESLDFNFIKDENICALLENYWHQGQSAFEVESYIGAIVAYGAVLEGILTYALLERRDEAEKSSRACKTKDGTPKSLKEWNLSNLIKVAVELELIGKTARDASWAIKDFRNFIHPYNLLKQSARPNKSLARSAEAGVGEIVRSLRGRISKEYTYSHEDESSMEFRWIEEEIIAGCRGPRTDNDLAFLVHKRNTFID